MSTQPEILIRGTKETVVSNTRRVREYFGRRVFGKRSEKTVYQIGADKITYDPGCTLVLQARHGFGDNLMVTAVVESIRGEYPDLNIIVLAKHPEIFAHNPHILGCYHIDLLSKRHPLRRAAVDLEYKKLEERRRRKTEKSHYIDELYDRLPIKVVSRCYKPSLFLTEQELSYRYAELKQLARPLVAIAPYGKKRSPIPSKIYPQKRWERVVQLLLEAGVNVVQVGSGSEGPLLPGAGAWLDLGYRHTASVLYHCNAVITHPGGIMHLAVACGVPCLALFGGIEDPRVSGYSQNRNLCVALDCAPCWRRELCQTPRCLDLMTPEKVAAEALDLIGSSDRL
jgi:ADP-heptose:LPS heptosyltransferase